MNRLAIAFVALTLAATARAQDAAAPAAPDTAEELAKLEGKLASLEEQYAETKNDVAGLKRLKFSGYVQARFAYLEAAAYNTEIAKTTAAGPASDNFYIRRGRLKAVYDADLAQFVMQIDAIPSAVSLKEAYATVKLPAGLAIDAGLQLFPFGYEVGTRSSADLDLLERAAVTTAFLDGEYDLGVSLRGARGPLAFRVGLFNGNGVKPKAGVDNDQLKDLIGRATYDLGFLTVGASGWYGKTKDYSRPDDKAFPRVRAGLDAQLYLDLLPVGGTALKGEYIWGKTTIGGTSNGGAGGNLPATTSDAPVPTGSGWYVLATQNLGKYEQLAARYEQYVPNQTASTSGDTNKTVKVNTAVEVAAHTYVGGNYKLSLAWFHPMYGEKGAAAASGPKADTYLVQAQAKF
jgi:hypothetical protein